MEERVCALLKKEIIIETRKNFIFDAIKSQILASKKAEDIEKLKEILKLRYQIVTIPQLVERLFEMDESILASLETAIDFSLTTSFEDETPVWYRIEISHLDEDNNTSKEIIFIITQYECYRYNMEEPKKGIHKKTKKKLCENMIYQFLNLENSQSNPLYVCIDKLYVRGVNE